MKHLMRDTVLVYPTPSVDEYGRDTFSASIAYKGRFVLKSIMIIDSKGAEVQADAICYLPIEVTSLSINDKVEYGGVSYRVIALEKPKDDTRERYIKVTLKKKI